MFGKTITLFKLFGFAVRVDASWLVIVLLVTWSLAAGVFPLSYGGLESSTYWIMGIVAALALFGSVVIHEMCHSLVARRYGLPMNGITLFLFGGVAEMGDEPPTPRSELLMALAGPGASAVLAGLFLGVGALGRAASWPLPVVGVIHWTGYINAILVAFNMIPGFPLDGGRVLRSILWGWRGNLLRATRTASRVGSGFGLLLIALGVINILMLNALGGLWWILIGVFIRSAARQGYQQVLMRTALAGEPVSHLMNDHPVTVPAREPLDRVVDEYIYRHHFKMFPVVDDGRLLGSITTSQIRDIPRTEWPKHTAAEVAQPADGNVLAPDQDAVNAFSAMGRGHNEQMMVVQGDHLVGLLTLGDLMKFLTRKLELEDQKAA